MDEPLYDRETLQKVTALAERLQRQQQELLTAGEIEAAGREVGLEPVFVRQALARLAEIATPTPKNWWPWVVAWWAAAWSLPLVFGGLMWQAGLGTALASFFLGLSLYIGAGIGFTMRAWNQSRRNRARAPRADWLRSVRALQKELEQELRSDQRERGYGPDALRRRGR